MCRLLNEITVFLEDNGFACSRQIRYDMNVISVKTADGRYSRIILPLEINSTTPEEAAQKSRMAADSICLIHSLEGYPLIITEDRWRSQKKMMEARLLAHLESFSQAYARNCEVRRIEKAEAQDFLNRHHSYGYVACRYRYGLFLKRHTGHNAAGFAQAGYEGEQGKDIGRLIAVATFSNARRWIKDGKEIRSYEWTRYASLPEMRVSGGMGKLLKAFIKEVKPDDIMSYSDLEWSEGYVYKTLGFMEEGIKEAVEFVVDKNQWKRFPIKASITDRKDNKMDTPLFFRNFGSRKFRLKLTDYK